VAVWVSIAANPTCQYQKRAFEEQLCTVSNLLVLSATDARLNQLAANLSNQVIRCGSGRERFRSQAKRRMVHRFLAANLQYSVAGCRIFRFWQPGENWSSSRWSASSGVRIVG